MSDTPNPLATRRIMPAPAKPDPMLRHAQIWHHVNQQHPDALHDHVQLADYALPIMGTLAANPKVTAKDVIKATSQPVADGKIPPSKGVEFISQIPPDPDKLQSWLKTVYADNLAATVHAKAALMRHAAQQAQGAPQGGPGMMPAGGQPMAPQGVAAPPQPMPGGPVQ